MNICVVGTGYVGLVAGTCLAESGNDVTCVDIDEGKIERLNSGEVPIYEPGLAELIERNMDEGRLSFTTELGPAAQTADVCFIAVGTPKGEDGSADLRYVLEAARQIAEAITSYTVIVTKSTVPVGTYQKVLALVRETTDVECEVASNPEFLREGAAVDDFLKPDRVVIGAESEKAADIMTALYEPFVRNENPILVMDPASAEMTKYASNAFLATKISFMNEIANLCERAGADIKNVRRGMGYDNRIGFAFTYCGVGYGGSCFPKDVRAIVRTAEDYDLQMPIVSAAEQVNNAQKRVLAERIIKRYGADLSGKRFALWGLSFKPQTDDMREAPSIDIIDMLTAAGAQISAYDPEAMEEAQGIIGDKITYGGTRDEILEGADALIIVTEWNEFRRPNFKLLKQALKEPVIFDGRNLYSLKEMREQGFEYHCIGRPSVLPAGAAG